MALFIGTQYERPDYFGFMKNPNLLPFDYKEFEEAVHMKQTDKEFKGLYWEARNKMWAQALIGGNGKSGLLNTAFVDSYSYEPNDLPEYNLFKNKGAWETLHDITNSSHGGYITAFDTETIGNFDINDLENTSAQVAGITEISFTTKHVSKNNIGKEIYGEQGSFVFGIDQNQKAWLEDILDRKIRGEVLNGTEQSAMERMSRYSTIEHEGHSFTFQRKEWQGKNFIISDSLNLSNEDSIDDIRSGINTLSSLYTQDREEQISMVVQKINSIGNGEFDHLNNRAKSAIIGQNLEYDINVINTYAQMHNTAKLDDKLQYADTMFAMRAYARENNITVGDLVKQYNGSISAERLGSLEAFMEAISDSKDYAKFAAHNAYQDSLATIDVMLNNGLDIVNRGYNVTQAISSQPNPISLSENIVKINKQGNIRSEDFLVIDNQITTGYSTANQYWKFSGAADMKFDELTITDPRNKNVEHTIRGTRDRYIAKFNLADNEDISLYKSFKSKEHFNNWLYYNTDIINPNNANIALQTQLHDKDVARRVIDGFFEVNQVGKASKADIGGFASFKKYYDMYTDISNMSNDAVKEMKLLNSNGKNITNSKQLLKNINVGNNIDAIIEYGDKNNVESITSFFRNAKYKANMTAHQAGISSYDERIKMQEIFSMFSNNKDFFEYANETITSATDNNLKQTILFRMMQEDYLGSKNVSFDEEIKYTIDDLNSVSIRTGKNTWSNIDVTNVNRGGNKLERLFQSEAKKATKNGESINAATSNMLFDTVDNLVDRRLLSTEDKRELTRLYSGSNDTNNLAKSIVQRLSNSTEQIRKDGLDEFVTNLEMVKEFGIKSFDENDRLYMTKVANKNHRTISESSTSVMSAVKGTIDKEFKDITSSKVHILDNATIVSGMLDDYSGNKKYVNQVGEQLKKMHYSDKGVEDLLRVFHSSNPHNVKANLKTINDKLIKEEKDPVLFAFYKPNKQDSSAFAIFTTQKHYAGLTESLANLGDEVTDERKIKEAIQGLGAYFEIPYLEVHDIGINSEGDKSIEALSKLATNNRQGHQARSVLVRQSDSSYKYDVLGLNLYKQGDQYHGSIRDQGDSFLTSIRPHFEQAMNSVSEGNYDSATRQLNNINQSKLSSDASPQMITVPDSNGKLRKMHVATQKDIDYAFMLSLGSEEDTLTDRDLSLKGLLRDFSTDAVASKAIPTQNNKTASQALTELYDIFNDEYKIVAPVKNGKHAPRNIKNVGKVFDSEQFEIFFKENVTNQAGGIQSERIVQRYLSNHPESALSDFKNMGLLEILNQAVQESPYAANDLKETIDLLTKSNLNAVGSEAMSKNNRVYVNYNMAENNNSRLSGQYRPTYAQRSNYRPYTLEDGVYFKDYKTLEENLGIHFGDVYTSDSFVKRMDKLDKDYNRYTSQSVTRRNIVGAVASLSDTEIQLNRANSAAQLKQLAAANGLDENALKNIYERMISGMNTYEGKAYLRPSLANQKFFMLGDTKNMKSNELHALWETGTEEEKRVTSTVLDELVKKGTVKNGDVIGYRLSNKNNMSPIFYNGPTVDNFSYENVDDLLQKGKTEVEVTRQIEDGKLFIGEEKGTYESFAYFNSLDEKKQLEEIKETMKSVGLTPTDNLDENIKTLNKYTDIAMDVAAPIEGSSHKVVALINTNINKHITDMPFDTKWNLIQYEFAQNGEQGFRDLRTIANEIVISKDNNTIETFGQHLRYNERHNTITFDNPNSKGSINVLDELIEKLRKSDLDEAKNAVRELDAFSKGNFAFQSIQRQQMNTFQGKAFKLDSRVYQALAMQSEGNYTRGNGAELAELIRQNILSGEYDEHISGVGRSRIDNVWSSIVHSRRGYLQPKNEHKMLLGIMDALSFKEGKLDISQKNILSININDVLANIPSSGANYEGYKNFIFKTDDEFSHFIKSYANKGGNNAILDASSNSFYLDFGRSVKYGDKNIEGILMPFQHISTAQDQIFLGESTKSTISFLNTYKKALEQSKPDEEINITEALDDLFKAYAKETDPYDKKSLASKVAFRMNMPNSSGALALDTIVPTLNPEVSGIISNDDIMRIAKLEASIGDTINLYGIGNESIQKDINELNKLYGLRKEAIKNQAALIKDKSVKLNEKILNLTGDKKYQKYILGTIKKPDGTIEEVIESAIVVGKQMFYNTEMDTGHIGHQLMTDYFTGRKGITKYDSFSKLKGKDFEISNNEFRRIFGFTETVDANNKVIPGNIAKKFKGTQHELWANETQQALDDIMFGNLAKYKNLSESARQAQVISQFNERVDKYIKNIQARVGFDGNRGIVKSADHALSQAEQRKFLLQINELFESVGDRYAKEVGILGMTNRYPNFSETGLLPVRIFLDDNIKGNSVRFLGPQFSILQNLDFDGDNEFLKFLGNGGLLAKDAVESEMMQKQFDFMNQFNREAYAQSIEDSIKSYRIGDETAFKATLLENIDKQKYNAAKEQFLKEMTEEDLKWFNGLNEDLQKYIYDHNKYITKEFVNFDKMFGTSFDNPQMVKAALQAKAAKEYIGNFSKPNLYVRNTLSYMLSDVEEGSQAEAELLRIKNLLFSFNNPEIKDGIKLSEKDIQSFGLLTLLEQQGIDTKHVHDADILNNSTAWREGINNLFRNAKNAPEINLEVKNSSIEQLVEGARKVFFGDIATADTNIPEVVSQISKDILNTSLDDLLEQASGQTSKELKANGLLGKIYIRGLYDLSNMDNAYEGFNGSLRKAGINPNFPKFLEALTNEDYDLLVKKSNYDVESIYIRTMHDSFRDKRFATDDALQVFGRKLHDNDILLYQSANGPVAYKFRGTESFDGQIMAKLSPYDLKNGKVGDEIITTQGITIRDLNEELKRNPRGTRNSDRNYLLDFARKDGNTDKNISSIYIDNLSNEERHLLIERHAAEISVADKLNRLFEERNDNPNFSRLFKTTTKDGMIVDNYDGYNNIGINRIIGNIVGTDPNDFRKKANTIEQYLQYGIDKQYISGSEDAKDLIRKINKNIAENPRSSINRFQGDTPFELVTNYLGDDVSIDGDKKWLRLGIENVTLSNEIDEAVKRRIEQQHLNLDLYAKNFYESVGDEKAFQTALESYNKEVSSTMNDVFSQFNRSNNAKQEFVNYFGWEHFNKNKDFNIQSLNVKITGEKSLENLNAKVGYGRYIGTKLSDLNYNQVQEILDNELTVEIISNLADDSIEKYAAENTATILKGYNATKNSAPYLSFENADVLRTNYRALHEESEVAKEAALKSLKESAEENAEVLKKKTLLGDGIKESIKSMSPETKRYLKVGGGIAAGALALGVVGHALFDNDNNNNVEVPRSVTEQIGNGEIPDSRPITQGKSASEYPNENSDAKQTRMQKRKIAPPSLHRNRTIYHDAGSGFNFKVSAQSYNKLQDEAYHRMAQQAGIQNNSLYVSRDNSKITDNWLENKFAQLME